MCFRMCNIISMKSVFWMNRYCNEWYLGVFAVIKLRMIDKCHCHFKIIFVVLNVRNCTLPYFSSSTILEAKNIEHFRAQINLNVLQNRCCLEAPLELISVVALQCHHTSHIRHHLFIVGVVGSEVLSFNVHTSAL